MASLRILLVCLVVASSICCTVASVKIAAFNIQVFGQSKIGKPEVVDILKKIISRYDMVLIQEIRDKAGTAIEELLDEVNEFSSDTYLMEIGPRVGRTSSQEQYAYFYKKGYFTVKGEFTYSDPGDVFEREPYVVLFDSPKTNVGEFSVIGLHAKPDDAVSEIDRLTAVYDKTVSTFSGNQNSIIMGDFNADCSYVRDSDWNSISLYTDSRFKWLIGHSADTTVSSTDCAYDRIVVAGGSMRSNAGGQSVFKFDDFYNLSNEEAKDVSDHYPVDFVLN